MKRDNGRWIARYTALYLAVAVPLLLFLTVFQKSLFWGGDAALQQYPVMRYTHDVLRALFSGDGLEMVNLSLGQGLDTIGTLAYYGLTDPLQWPAALFTGIGIEIYYHFLVFFYIYSSGLLFGFYIRKVRLIGDDEPWLIALAGLVFATCGYQTIGVIKNPYYAAGSLYLVLQLIAVERALRDRKWPMMSLVTALMLMANFYLAYQTSILTAIYCLIRLIARWKARGARNSIGDGLRLMGAYFLGLALSAAVLIPSAYSFLISGRTGVSGGYTASLLHYPPVYYLKLIMLFCAPYDYAGYWVLQSFSPLALFGVALLFMRRKDLPAWDGAARKQVRAGFLILFLCLCVPLAGKVFNGFGYVTNRWSYGWAVAACLAAAQGLSALADPDFEGRMRLAQLGLIWGVLMLGYSFIASKLPGMNGAGNDLAVSDMGFDTKRMAALGGALAVLAAAGMLLWLERRLHRNPRGAARMLVLLGALCCMVYTVGYGYVAAFSGAFANAGLEEEAMRSTEAAAGELPGDAFFRVDTGFCNDNQAGFLDYNGTSYYWSLIPSWVSGHYTDLELSTQRWSFRVYGLGGDSYLNALASVGYALRSDSENGAALPYGFVQRDDLEFHGGAVTAYENAYALPLGYAFFEVMSESDYAQLDPVRKREALTAAAVLRDDGDGLPAFAGELPCEELDWEVVSAEGVELDGNVLRGRAGGTLTLRFDGPPDSEIYLHVSGAEALYMDEITDMSIAALSESGLSGAYIIRRDGVFNYAQTGVCMRLGWSEEGMKECTLRFSDAAEIRFDDIWLLSVPAENYRASVEKLRANGWSPVMEKNRVHGRMVMNADGVLQISLPWSAGWSATVDGERAEVLRCGGMYMGLRLDAGEHEIALRYVTPGLVPGVWVSLGALIVMLILWLLPRLRRAKSASA